MKIPGYSGLQLDWTKSISQNPHHNVSATATNAVFHALRAIGLPAPVSLWIHDPLAGGPNPKLLSLTAALSKGLPKDLAADIEYSFDEAGHERGQAAPIVAEFARDFNTALRRYFDLHKEKWGIKTTFEHFLFSLNASELLEEFEQGFTEALGD